MYHCKLHFVLYNVSQRIIKAIQKITPLDNFTHDVSVIDSLNESFVESVKRNSIVILGESEDYSEYMEQLSHLHKDSENTYIILLSKKSSKIPSDFLSLVDDIWVLPMSETIFSFKVHGLLVNLQKQKDLEFQSNCYELLLDMLPDLFWIKDIPGKHLKVNSSFCEAVGKDMEDVTGKYHNYIWGTTDDDKEHGESVCHESELVVLKEKKTCYFEEEIRHAKKGICKLDVYKTPIYDEDGVALGTIGIARDVTLEKEQKNKILQMAQTDPLTGLANRRYFYEMISESDKSHGMTVCYFDLDNFKELNDTYGHNYGDDALIGVADLFRHAFQNDFITRIGGDEFVASVIGSPNKRLMSVRLDVLMRNAELFFSKKEYTRGLSMSIGVSYSENDSLPIDTLIQQSDAALYHSKHTGKNKYSFYDDIV